MTGSIRVPRGRRTTSTAVVALLLLIAAAAVGYLAVYKALDRRDGVIDIADIAGWLRDTTFGSSVVLIIGIVIAVVGLLVLAVAVLPSSRRLIELAVPDERTAAGVGKRSLRRTLQSAAVAVDGISAARTDIGRRRVKLDVTSSLRHTDGLQDAASTAVNQRLTRLSLRQPRTLTSHLTRKES